MQFMINKYHLALAFQRKLSICIQIPIIVWWIYLQLLYILTDFQKCSRVLQSKQLKIFRLKFYNKKEIFNEEDTFNDFPVFCKRFWQACSGIRAWESLAACYLSKDNLLNKTIV